MELGGEFYLSAALPSGKELR